MNWTVGNIRITKVVESELSVPFDAFLAGVDEYAVQRHPWLAPDFVTDGRARTSIHGLVVDTGDQRVLVDTGIGDMRAMAGVPAAPSGFLDTLAAAGYEPGDIDIVVCTHLHFDHVGWNTRRADDGWQVTFPNARYLFGRREWEFWQSNTSEVVDLTETARPVVEAGRADLIETDHLVCSGVRLEPVPGHTPGQVCVHIEDRGEHAVITGDLAHHPVQLAEPQVCSLADSDRAQSEATRRRFFAERVADGALVIGTHFVGPTAGHIVADGSAWRLVE